MTPPRIEYQWGRTGLVYASSPDVPGLLLGRPSLPELIAAVPLALADLEGAEGIPMPSPTTPDTLSEARDDLLEMIAHEVAGLCIDDEGMGAKDIYAAITKFRLAREKAINA